MGPVELIDTHAHLDFPAFAPDLDAVVERARGDGVRTVVTIGIDLERSAAACRLAGDYPGVYAAVGVHPLEAGRAAPDPEAAVERLRALAADPRVVAIGETGLDFYRGEDSADAQRRLFEAQLALAAELGLPVIVHQRRAEEAVLDLLRSWRPRLAGVVLHCFTGDADFARRCAQLDVYFGIGGVVTFPNAGALREAVARAMPRDRIVLETDAPFLAPQPRRGRRNEPAYVRWVAGAVADCLGLDVAEVAALTTANARRLFPRLAAAAGWSP